MLPRMNNNYTYQKTNCYLAQYSAEMEELGAEELKQLGATAVTPVFRGVQFEADQAALYRIVYCSRLASRINAPLISFDCHSDRYLYKTAKQMSWTDFLQLDQTFSIQATVSDSHISHSQFAALRLKDAIVDAFRENCGSRPNVDPKNADVQFHLRIRKNRATISVGASGRALHKRGYRVAGVDAPMKETLAAAIINYSGWDGECALVDPMCGSGTLVAEALMHYCRIPAGYLHPEFGFRFFPEFDEALWLQVKADADGQIRELPEGLLFASDCDGAAVDAARMNLGRLPGGEHVQLSQKRYQEMEEVKDAVLICNPPYGIRLEKNTDMGAFMKEFGDFLKQKCTGSSAYIYFGKVELVKRIGLRTAFKKILYNGSLEGRLARYNLY